MVSVFGGWPEAWKTLTAWQIAFQQPFGWPFLLRALGNMAKDDKEILSLESPESVKQFRIYEKSEICTLSCCLRENPILGLWGEQLSVQF